MFPHPNIWSFQVLVWLCMAIVPTILSEENKKPKDYILCRQCGTDIASAETLINLRSPAAVERVNESLFGLDQVYVQTLVNPLNIRFKVVTLLEASVSSTSKRWSPDHSWFPGYAWKPCACSRCHQHIGWAFEPLEEAVSHKVKASDKGFYALVLDSVISEFYSNQLLIAPQTVTIR